jgi:sugar O-acyltransferase (sialic acid O-acetyltransferase NeuD family)
MDTIIGLLGSGGQADEVASYLDGIQVDFRAVDAAYVEASKPDIIDIKSAQDKADTPVIAAVGAPGLRKAMVEKWPGHSYFTLTSQHANVNPGTQIGEGTVIAPATVVTTNVRIGKHTLINIGATINHDCTVGDFVTISPGVHIAGKVTIGNGVFIGIGASISNGVRIAAGSVIGAGAVVLEDVTAENSVMVGVPAKLVKNNEGWLSEI